MRVVRNYALRQFTIEFSHDRFKAVEECLRAYEGTTRRAFIIDFRSFSDCHAMTIQVTERFAKELLVRLTVAVNPDPSTITQKTVKDYLHLTSLQPMFAS